MEAYQNTALSPGERAADLLSRMSLEEKMGQVVGYYPNAMETEGEFEAAYPQGAGQVSCLEMRSLEDLSEAAAFQRDIQTKIMALSEHHIPAIFHMEGLCGAYLPGAASFASGIGRGAAWDPGLEERIGEIVGRQERAAGITQTLAPVLDISHDSRMGRQGETYGEDPVIASALGSAFVRGLQGGETGGRRSESVAKHFLGFHASEGGIHGTVCEITDHTLRELYAKPFQAAITEAGLRGVMPCYCSINGEPVSASKRILTGLLREEMGFDGVAVSDYCAVSNIHNVQKLCDSPAEAGLRAMEAGMDMELHFKACFNEELAEWFRTGKADIGILDRAVRRILEAKFRMGLFEHPFALTGDALTEAFGREEDRRISLDAARESLVLLKNNGVLPVAPDVKKIAVIGWQASTARIFYGGYTHFSMAEGLQAAISTMAGLQTEKGEKEEIPYIPGTRIQADDPSFEEVLKRQNPKVKSLLEQLKTDMPGTTIVYAEGYTFAGDDLSGHEEALRAAAEADLVILTLGGKHGTGSIASMGEGIDASEIGLPPCQEEFLKKLARLQKPSVGIHFNGRPVSSDAAEECLDAILEAWNPSEGGAQAIVEALLGRYNPGGKLPLSVARRSGQIPVYYNHVNGSGYHQGESIAFSEYVDLTHKPRYPFGYGLSYTEFSYSDLRLSAKCAAPEDVIEIQVTVKNTGRMAGDEVVQLYIQDEYAQMIRPVKELAGFLRVSLAPGESKTVVFRMKVSQTAFVGRDGNWIVEAGNIQVMIGSSSEEIRLTDSFAITQSREICGRERGFYAEARAAGM